METVASFMLLSSANNDTLTSFFAICICLISFSCLLALVKTSSTILNRYGGSGPYLVHDFSSNAFRFFPFKLIQAMALM